MCGKIGVVSSIVNDTSGNKYSSTLAPNCAKRGPTLPYPSDPSPASLLDPVLQKYGIQAFNGTNGLEPDSLITEQSLPY